MEDKAKELYLLRQNLITVTLGGLEADVRKTIVKANGTWTSDSISAINDFLEIFDYYKSELEYHRDLLQKKLDNK